MNVKEDYFLIQRGNKFLFSPIYQKDSICIGGVHRLKLVEKLIPYINQVKVFAHPEMKSQLKELADKVRKP